jgi:hypothetical protein
MTTVVRVGCPVCYRYVIEDRYIDGEMMMNVKIVNSLWLFAPSYYFQLLRISQF